MVLVDEKVAGRTRSTSTTEEDHPYVNRKATTDDS